MAATDQRNASLAYRRICLLGSGGMATVDLAVRRSGSFERLFAVKRLPPETREDPQLRAMFTDEARLAGFVRHPNVVAVVDFGEDDEGPFLAMEYVAGVTAAQLILDAKRRGAPLPLQICLRVARDTAHGLHAAHEASDNEGRPLDLVHRDVSPQNVLVGFDGEIRVSDFGVAKGIGRESQTTTGVVKGKFGYLSPEQLRRGEVDRRADIFSLGVVLYELLTCRRLYPTSGGLERAVVSILMDAVPDVGLIRDAVPHSVVELLFDMLAKQPALRPESCAEVAQRLDAAVLELALTEGSIDLGAFVNEHFGDERDARRAEIASAVMDARRIEESGPAERNGSPVQSRRRDGWLLVPGVLVGAVLFLGGAAVLAVNGSPREAVSEGDVVEAIDARIDAGLVESVSSGPTGAASTPLRDAAVDWVPNAEAPRKARPRRTGRGDRGAVDNPRREPW